MTEGGARTVDEAVRAPFARLVVERSRVTMVLAAAASLHTLALFVAVDGGRALDEGHALLESQEIEQAAPLLEAAARDDAGPYARDDVVKLYRDLGLLRSYLDDAAGAEAAFRKLLLVDPGHALPYTTSPRATFIFEKARAEASSTAPTAIFVDVPAAAEPGQALAASVVVDADPQGLTRGTLRWRKAGDGSWRAVPLLLPSTGARASVQLVDDIDAVDGTVSGADSVAIELAVDAYDARGWQLYAGPTSMRTIAIVRPTPWYASGWLWAGVGVVAVAVTAGSVALALQPVPSTVPGSAGVTGVRQ